MNMSVIHYCDCCNSTIAHLFRFRDIVVLAHELGHNFGSRHTHDANGYSPLVDDCGNGGCNSLVTGEAVSAGEASLMSYCNKCTGGSKLFCFHAKFHYDNNSTNLSLCQSQIWVRRLVDTGLKTIEAMSIIGIVRFCLLMHQTSLVFKQHLM
jgi:hypothetical protein